jgi:hypothetical protein
MNSLLRKLYHDDAGTVSAPEWIFVATLLALGAVTGVVVQRRADPGTFTHPDSALMNSQVQGGEIPANAPR